MKTLKIFEYKGEVGAISDLANGTFMNKIDDTFSNQVGVVVSTKEVIISPSALEIMKNKYRRSGGSFASTMLSPANEYFDSSIALFGFNLHVLTDEIGNIEYGTHCDLSVLDDIEVDSNIEVPDGFKEVVDSGTLSYD